MIPEVPKTNLFQTELRYLSDQAREFGAFLMEYKWWLIAGAAILVILFFRHFRGNRQ